MLLVVVLMGLLFIIYVVAFWFVGDVFWCSVILIALWLVCYFLVGVNICDYMQ